jgi:hypothetical protein
MSATYTVTATIVNITDFQRYLSRGDPALPAWRTMQYDPVANQVTISYYDALTSDQLATLTTLAAAYVSPPGFSSSPLVYEVGPNADFHSIQDALTSARFVGDVPKILLNDGVYVENNPLVLDSGMSLASKNGAVVTTVMAANPGLPLLQTSGNSGVSNITLLGAAMAIQHDGGGGAGASPGVLSLDSLVILGCGLGVQTINGRTSVAVLTNVRFVSLPNAPLGTACEARDSSYMALNGSTFSGVGGGSIGTGINVSSSAARVECYLAGFGSCGAAVRVNGGVLHLVDCEIINNSQGLVITGGPNFVTLMSCNFETNTVSDIDMSNTTFDQSTLYLLGTVVKVLNPHRLLGMNVMGNAINLLHDRTELFGTVGALDVLQVDGHMDVTGMARFLNDTTISGCLTASGGIIVQPALTRLVGSSGLVLRNGVATSILDGLTVVGTSEFAGPVHIQGALTLDTPLPVPAAASWALGISITVAVAVLVLAIYMTRSLSGYNV